MIMIMIWIETTQLRRDDHKDCAQCARRYKNRILEHGEEKWVFNLKQDDDEDR